MVRNVIRPCVLPGKHDELRDVYSRHFDAFRASGDRILGYEILADTADDTVVFAIKTLESEQDFEDHNASATLADFLDELNPVPVGPPEFRRCNTTVAP